MEDQPLRRSKRLQMNNNAPPSKRMKLSRREQNVVKDFGLNFDCLDLIFEYLDAEALLNAAIARQIFQAPALAVYRRKFASKWICLYVSKTSDTEVKEEGNYIDVKGTRACKAFLRYFGPSIAKLQIRYRKYEPNIKLIYKWINQCCAEYLTDISFCGVVPEITQKQFQKPFINVERLMMGYSNRCNRYSPNLECFPNLREMTLRDKHFDQLIFNKPFQRLQHLDIMVQGNQFARQINNFIAMHPQLTHLSIEMYNKEHPFSLCGIGDMIRDTSITELLVYNTCVFSRDAIGSHLSKLTSVPSLVKNCTILFKVLIVGEAWNIRERINRIVDQQNSSISGQFRFEMSTPENMNQLIFFGSKSLRENENDNIIMFSIISNRPGDENQIPFIIHLD